MRLPIFLFSSLLAAVLVVACKKEDPQPEPTPTAEPRLIFKFQFDSTQARLDNTGQPAAMPAGHAGQNPKMNLMSAHYLELAPSAFTQLGNGIVLYRATETTIGGSNAIDFAQATKVGNGQEFFSVPIKDVTPGQYEYLRLSLAYQNYDVKLYLDTVVNTGSGNITIQQDLPCTVASFVGFNTYITNYLVKNQSITVNGNREQGYWGFESTGTISGYPYNYLNSGQAPAGATTVVNPIASTSPILAGSCVVTGPFNAGKLTITGSETNDIVVLVSLSTNQSFEWIDGNGNGKWEPSKGEKIVDMGLRGMIPIVQ